MLLTFYFLGNFKEQGVRTAPLVEKLTKRHYAIGMEDFQTPQSYSMGNKLDP